MNDEELVAMIVVFGTGLAIVAIVMRYRATQERLALIEKALAQPDLDADSRQRLVDKLTGAGDSHSWKASLASQISIVSRNALFVAGWVTLFVGVGCILTDDHWLVEGGIIAAATGLGVATIPLALRELQGRTSSN